MSDSQDAFVLHISHRDDALPKALESNDVVIGWSRAGELHDSDLDWNEFREIVHQEYHSDQDNYRRAGASAGNLWRFIREMEEGDLVVVPDGSEFYVAEVTGDAGYEPERIEEDTAHRRSVKWLNDGESILRGIARSALQSRMKARQTCVEATDLIDEIQDALEAAQSDEQPSFDSDLRQKLVQDTLEEMRTGRQDSFGFEKLVKSVLQSLGGENVTIVPRSKDQGADITALFTVADTFSFTVAAQAKHYRETPEVPPKDVEQLRDGMDAEGATLGWLVTSGTFSEETEELKNEIEDETGYEIQLVDGEQLAALIVDGGLRAASLTEDE
ncbi:restriction endonuclease [Salinibacter ruber]|uniref:restriction endonuclease n=1 Tax=Salinibacter ruber TaxID=146919 RepID=UPI0020740848|nr:restriction endonuclease [Salinibacter ruber]MCS3664523.1 putative Mrr-cat superfamily restriction endonuclease [Salinibacter ruber]